MRAYCELRALEREGQDFEQENRVAVRMAGAVGVGEAVADALQRLTPAAIVEVARAACSLKDPEFEDDRVQAAAERMFHAANTLMQEWSRYASEEWSDKSMSR